MSDASPPPVDPIPEEYGSLIIQLIVGDARAAIAFYKTAFDANELYRQYDASGAKIVHCELLLGRSRLMLHDEFEARELYSPARLGGTPVTLMLYVEDVDRIMARARTEGARIVAAAEDKFWGVRSGVLCDPFGHRWLLASRTEDLSPSDILERAKREPESARIPLGAPIKPSD
jgi:PhnB protein